MGIEWYLIKDETREIYNLGKGTYDWAIVLATPDSRSGVERQGLFQIDHNIVRVTADLGNCDGVTNCDPRYYRLVAEDVARWASDAWVRLSSDSSHDGWRNQDGSWDDGRVTGSRYSNNHPEWDLGARQDDKADLKP